MQECTMIKRKNKEKSNGNRYAERHKKKLKWDFDKLQNLVRSKQDFNHVLQS